MSDYEENCADIFDRLAAQRFHDQADIDTDSVFSSLRGTKVKKAVKRQVMSVIDEDELQNIALESEVQTCIDKLVPLKLEQTRWEKVRSEAIKNKVDPKRVAKVSQKISQLFFEIQELELFIEKNGKSFKQNKEVRDIENQVEQLELERSNIEAKLTLLADRLRELRPYSAESDFQNNPAQTDSSDDAEFEALAQMIAERRRTAVAAGEYNGDAATTSRGVTIKNPKRSSDY